MRVGRATVLQIHEHSAHVRLLKLDWSFIHKRSCFSFVYLGSGLEFHFDQLQQHFYWFCFLLFLDSINY